MNHFEKRETIEPFIVSEYVNSLPAYEHGKLLGILRCNLSDPNKMYFISKWLNISLKEARLVIVDFEENRYV